MLSRLLGIGISLLLGAVSWTQARSALDFADRTTMLAIPLAPVVFFMSALLFCNALVLAAQWWLGRGAGARCTSMTEALIGFAAMLALVLLRVPVAFAMTLIGVIGVAYLRNGPSAYAMAGVGGARERLSSTLLSVVPLFVLMGNFVTQAGLSRELYRAAYAFLGHRRGGLAMSTIVACGAASARSADRAWPPPQRCRRSPIRRCASSATARASPPARLPPAARSAY